MNRSQRIACCAAIMALTGVAWAGYNADINGDGRIDSTDLALLLGAWNGQVPPAVTLQVLPHRTVAPLRLTAKVLYSMPNIYVHDGSEVIVDPESVVAVGTGAGHTGPGTVLVLDSQTTVVVLESYNDVVNALAQARGWDITPPPPLAAQ